MKHPTPSDFIVNVQESHVGVDMRHSDGYANLRLRRPV
jgi:hypothetical protein